jgi:outer membrane receptor protein involved in Fe transport
MKRLILVFMLLSPSLPARAESSEDLEMLRLEDLMEIEVRAPSKLGLRMRDAPTVGNVVNRQQIESYGWISANDIIFKQAGFAPSQDYERMTVSARGVHEGWNNNHLLMLVDGVPHNNNVNSTAYTWEITPLYMVDTLEVTRGPGSALYGSSAMNGIIALNTVEPSNEHPAQGMVRFGNAGTHIYDLMASHAWRDIGFVVAYNHTDTDGNVYQSYDASGRRDASGALEKFTVNDAQSSDYAWLKIEGAGKLRGLSLQFHYRWWSFGTGQGWLFDVPDRPEHMTSNTQNLALTWRPRPLIHERLQMEWVVMWERQEVDYDADLYPSGVGGFPNGLAEVLDNETNAMFARGQASFRIWRELALLAGVENRLFAYGGDHVHTANANLTSGQPTTPYPDNVMRPQLPALAPVINRPVDNVGVYAQLTTGRVFRQLVSLTAGLRYDVESARYATGPNTPDASLTFQQLSPRVALLVYPWRDLVFKAMFDRAFRAPAPTELFGANTYFISSNINQTKPETLSSLTLAGDLMLWSHLDLRLDWYWRQSDNPIDFSASAPNLATNLYSLTVTGVEAEAYFDVPLDPLDVLSGYANYSYTHQLGETVVDTTIQASNQLAWYPEHVFNFGASFVGHDVGLSVQGHYQGRVYRRPSDYTNPDGTPYALAAYRSDSVAPWFTLDARVSYRVLSWLRLGAQGTNLTDTKGYFLKTGRYPFDYQLQGIRVLGTAEILLHAPR